MTNFDKIKLRPNMKKRQFILCAVFCATCTAAADSQNSAEQPVDLGKLFMAFGKLSLSSVKKGFEYGYSKLKPTNFTDGLVKALFLNNIAWATPKVLDSLRSKSNLISHAIALPFSALATRMVAGQMSELLGQGTKQSNRDTLYLQACLGTFPVIHSTINGVVSTFLPSDDEKNKPSTTANEEAAKAIKALDIEYKAPINGISANQSASFDWIKIQCASEEKGIKDFIDALRSFDPNEKKAKTPTLSLYGEASTGKTERMKAIGEAAREDGWKIFSLFQSSSDVDDNTYYGVAKAVYKHIGDTLIKSSGKKMLILDELFASEHDKNDENSKKSKGNAHVYLNQLITRLAKAKVPIIFATNKPPSEIDPTSNQRMKSRGKTWSQAFSARTVCPGMQAIQIVTEAKIKEHKLPYNNLQYASNFIGTYLSGCNWGMIINALDDIVAEHKKQSLVINFNNQASKNIIVPQVARYLKQSLNDAKNEKRRYKTDGEKGKDRDLQLYKKLSGQYVHLVKENANLLVQDAFKTSDGVKVLVNKIEKINNIISPKKEEKKEKKPEEKKEDIKIEEKDEKKPEEKKFKKEENIELKKEDKLDFDKLLKTLRKNDPIKLINLFKKYTQKNEPKKDDDEKVINNDPPQIIKNCFFKEAKDIVAYYHKTEKSFYDSQSRMNAVVTLASILQQKSQDKNAKIESSEFIAKLLEIRDSPVYNSLKTLSSGASIKKGVYAAAYNLSYYTYMGHLPEIIGKARSILPSLPSFGNNDEKKQIRKKTRLYNDTDIVRYKKLLAPFVVDIPHHQTLINILVNLAMESGMPEEMLARSCVALINKKNDKLQDVLIKDELGTICVKEDVFNNDIKKKIPQNAKMKHYISAGKNKILCNTVNLYNFTNIKE